MKTTESRDVVNAFFGAFAIKMSCGSPKEQEKMMELAEETLDDWFTDKFEEETRSRDTSRW